MEAEEAKVESADYAITEWKTYNTSKEASQLPLGRGDGTFLVESIPLPRRQR